MKTKDEMTGIAPVSENLYDEMFVHELEDRLETDPLLANGLLNLVTTMDPSSVQANLLCTMCNFIASNQG